MSARVSVPGVLATVVVTATIVGAVVALGPPSQQREHRLDARRVENLSAIVSAVDRYWSLHKRLPGSLDTLVLEHQLDRGLQDPESGVAYQFSPTALNAFRLCATFARPSDEEAEQTMGLVAVPSWRHGAGTTCFDRSVPARNGQP